MPIDRHVQKRERGRYQRQQDRAQNGPKDRPLAARQAGTADHRRSDDVQLHPYPEGRLGRAETDHVDDARHPAKRGTEDRRQENHTLGANTGIGGGLFVAARIVHQPECRRAPQQKVEDCNDHDKDHDRHRDDAN